jgi:radical SAM protein with 4Fe4S-binding SPASM domain
MAPGFICELTPDCNLRCGFCYNVWLEPGAPKVPASAVLDLDGWVRVLAQLPMDGGVEWLCFAGGEPLLSDVLLPLARHVRKAHPGVRLGVASNGTLLSEARLRELSETLDYLELSLLSLDRTRYLALTGRDSLAEAKAAIALAAGLRIPLTVAITLVPMPPAELSAMLDFALAFGARKLALSRFAASGRGAVREPEFRLSTSALRELLAAADAFARKRRARVDVTLPVEDCLLAHADFPHLRFHPCVCGDLKWTIGPTGQLRVCEQSSLELGDLRACSFEQLRALPAVDAFRAQNFCSRGPECAKWEQCGGGCRFVRHDPTGQSDSPTPECPRGTRS